MVNFLVEVDLVVLDSGARGMTAALRIGVIPTPRRGRMSAPGYLETFPALPKMSEVGDGTDLAGVSPAVKTRRVPQRRVLLC